VTPTARIRERRDIARRNLLVQRIMSEFREMPCLRLTCAQAERLFGLRPDVTTRIIDGLVRNGALRVEGDGRYTAGDST
jgi:hypothetical protein